MTARGPAPGKTDETRSFIERARREQLIRITIDLVAQEGYAAASLTRIARTAGITKGAVLYHFASRDAVVAAALDHVLDALVAEVGAAVDAAPAERAPAVYVRRMVGHLAEHRDHARMITEAMAAAGPPAGETRWGPLAGLLAAARGARGLGPGPDPRTLAIIAGGAIDGIVGEWLRDDGYDTAAAADTLVAVLEAALFPPDGGTPRAARS
ncbi:TetR/AcrR family transcriptional regulator [Actinomadura sp. WAC 06369]|uniref:TetR/AcrR family transcriptional regulator n=1 Tax=Actinomadura sp. WAC 06369 TaxID=2203193 RepID=UPI000F77A897|nr:TetR/AcrR family transcriptional regulator [Actinomadura sp. WAC 06369]RSN48978.1 TetR family transcriptional regulator [Actinomadura sp. WAC 06369]